MIKIHNISEIHPTLGFTEFDILEKYRKSFNKNELDSFQYTNCVNGKRDSNLNLVFHLHNFFIKRLSY